MTQVIGAALQLGGMPVPVGGGVRLVDALAGIVTDAGGEVRLSADVRQVLVANGRATGVRLTDGEFVAATRAVVANVTPTQLYGSLLGGSDVPSAVAEAAARFRYGRAEMQIHLALDEPPRWKGGDAERLARCPIVHVTPGLDGVSRAVNEAERGLLPAEATIVCGQPVALDPSRAPDGKSIIWIQLQELPAGRIKGDAAGDLDTGDGSWTDELQRGVCRPHRRPARRLDREPRRRDAEARRRLSARPRGAEPQSRRRRHLRRLVRARPESPLAPARRGARSRDRRGRTLAHRCEHASRAGAWRGLRLPRREGADEAPDHAAAPREVAGTLMTLSLSEISTPGASFAEDVEAYAAAGFDAIGIWEFKLPPDDEANLALLAEHGLAVSVCVPEVPSVLPLAIAGMEGPSDVAVRIAALEASVRRLAAYNPECVACLAGPLGDNTLAEGTDLLVGALQRLGAVAREAGTWVGFEPVHRSQRDEAGFVNSLNDADGVLAVAGAPQVGILFDTYHLWDDPEVLPWIEANISRIVGVHISDWPAADRTDRVLPTEGISHTLELVAALVLAGWDGALDVEIFSTPELFWGLPVDEAARRAYAAAAPLD